MVVSWNTRELLSACLSSLRPEVDAGRARVRVVDNGSGDGSREMVRSRFAWADLLESDANLGFGPAVNLGAREAQSDWIAAANADIELTPGALEALLRAGDEHPDAGVIAPRLILADGSTQHSVHRFPSPQLALLFGLGAYRLSRRLGDSLCIEGAWDPDRPRRVDWAHGAFLLIRREAFERVGGFDERQWLYAEEVELSWKLAQAGRPVYYEPAAPIRHGVGASTRQAFGQWERDRRRTLATYAWLSRRRGAAVARLTAALNFAGAAARFGTFAVLGLLAPGRWGRARARSRRWVALHREGLSARATPREAR